MKQPTDAWYDEMERLGARMAQLLSETDAPFVYMSPGPFSLFLVNGGERMQEFHDLIWPTMERWAPTDWGGPNLRIIKGGLAPKKPGAE